jgi:preprotein translocase subunit YajC
LVIIVVLLLGLVALSRRNRQRVAVAEKGRVEQITVGTAVMTTAGLYATVVALNRDETALLSIAPGVEVRWALAALRAVSDLPSQYRSDQAPLGFGDKPVTNAHSDEEQTDTT